MEIRINPISGEEVGSLLFWWGGKMKKYLPIVICLFSLLPSSSALAETKTFIKEYTYQASEFDSKASSRILVLEQVKRLLLEELGTYLESETEVKNFQLTKDQIVILTAGIVRAEIIDEKWDGKTYSLRAKIAADPKDVATSIKKLRQDRQKTKELEETRKKAEEALREVERLKKELKTAKADKTKFSQYNEGVDRLSATDWLEKGYVLGYAGKWQEAREAFTRAIELDPNNTLAYYNQATAFLFGAKEPKEAVEAYTRAIELDPNLLEAYFWRAFAYSLPPLGNTSRPSRIWIGSSNWTLKWRLPMLTVRLII